MNKVWLFTFLVVAALAFGFAQLKEANAGTEHNVSGFAWSETIGWISFNSTNCDVDGDGTYEGNNEGPVGARTPAPAGCPTAGTAQSYGVNVDNATGVFSGYAWSENIGWISFNTAELAGCLSGTCKAELNLATRQVSGWAKALAAQDGWDGWVKLRGQTTETIPTAYGVSWNNSTKEFEGWAWGSDVAGWINFNGANYAVSAALDTTPPVSQITSPSAGSFQNQDFPVRVADVDTGGSTLDINACKYSVTDRGTSGTASANGTTTTLVDTNRNEREGFWTGGLLKMTSGSNAGESKPVSSFTVSTHTIQVSQAFSSAIAQGDRYTMYRNSSIALGDTARTCNADSPPISVGIQPASICSTEGMNTCQVIVKSKDVAGNSNVISEAAGSLRRFSIDFTPPVVGPISCSADLSAPCTKVQQGTSPAMKSLVLDNVQVADCKLQRKTPSNPGSWQDIALVANDFTATPCLLGTGSNCLEISKSLLFSETGTYRMRAQCWDAFTTVTGSETVISADTLSVALEAIPTFGSVNTQFDLKATVSGTITGNINYKFDCNVNQAPTWNLEVDSSTQNPYTAVDLCKYASPSTYTAKVLVQRGVGAAENTVAIGPITANSVPTAANPLVDIPNSVGYCGVTGFPPVRVRWTFSDDDSGDTQSAYQIQVFQGGNKVVDTGKKSGSTQSYVFQSAGEQLLWDTTYTWQVKVWDNHDDAPLLFASGLQFITVKHHYPVPNFTKNPDFPGAQESVQFTDQTNFDEGGVNNSKLSINRSWSWTFGDGGSSTSKNPTHTYAQTGSFGVTLQSGDNVGSCSSSQTVNVSIPFPEWQEISPF